jgi:uncharacterized membrane protein
MRQFAAFCHEEDIHPLVATTQSIVRYTAWLGLQGIVAAASLQQYYSAIKNYSATTNNSQSQSTNS